MKSIKLVIAFLVASFFLAMEVDAQTYVNGYYRSNSTYVNGYYRSSSNSSSSSSSYSTPSSSFSLPSSTYSTPTYKEPSSTKNYDNGGQIYLQNGYYRSNGTYVEPHLKTKPDNNQWNNLNSIFDPDND